MMKYYPQVSEEYEIAITQLKRELRAFISEKQCAPIFVRLAWHDAGTYRTETQNGGANGSIISADELAHGANVGLDRAIGMIAPFKEMFPIVGWADLIQLAGYVAIEITGGPEIPFAPGRVDEEFGVEEGRLPDPSQGADQLRESFSSMGFSDQDIVALSGAHTLGRAHKDRSGLDGAWTPRPLHFDNEYYQILLKGGEEGLLRLPTDEILVSDEGFLPYVELYASDQEAFFADYAAAHKKLSELGQFDTCADEE